MNTKNELVLSEEQSNFIAKALEGRNILVDACIGSGKTTAIQMLCNELPATKKILYLTYNKLLKLDAKSKIKNENVTVQNYHGIAGTYLRRNWISVGINDAISTFNNLCFKLDKYDILIIDEYQDIKTEFATLLNLFKDANPKMQIIAVGDLMQKIYDDTTLNVYDFIREFLGDYLELEFTKCFRLNNDLAQKLSRVWKKKIVGVNDNCQVYEMSYDEAFEFISQQKTKDILCLGKNNGSRSEMMNDLEEAFPDKFNKNTVYSKIRDNDCAGTTEPNENSAIFDTFDGSKGMERKICVIFDFTESCWDYRLNQVNQSYEILRNIFCVAASRGKEKIIFVNDGDEMLSERSLSSPSEKKAQYKDVTISNMFDFKYSEDKALCYSLLDISPIETIDFSAIEVKRNDGLIDLSPCVGVYQEAMYFDSYSIDRTIDMYMFFHRDQKSLWNKEMKKSDIESKILFLTSLEFNQARYRNQVVLPFISKESENKLTERLHERLEPNEDVQIECHIDFALKYRGKLGFTARGFADAVKDDTVYELKFVSELSTENYLQCACYVVALNLEKGVLWNTRNNEVYEIRVPDKKAFLDAVAKTITKGDVSKYYKPVKEKKPNKKR